MKKLLTILVAVLAVSLAPVNAEAASVKKPVATTGSGTYYKSVTVKLKKKSGYKYYYTTNKKNPTNKSKKFGSKLTIKKNTELRVVAYKGKKKSSVAKYNYKIQKSYAIPDKAAGKYFDSQKVKFSLAKGYTYKYSTNGKKFNKLTSKTKVGVSGTKTITVKVYSGKKVKKTLKFKYEVKKPTIQTNASSGTYNGPISINFGTEENYTVKYSVDNGSWITLPSSGNLVVKKSGTYIFRIYDKSGKYEEEKYTFKIKESDSEVEVPSTEPEEDTTETPSGNNTVVTKGCSVTASKTPGTYNNAITVKFSCSKGHDLWYSFDECSWEDVTASGVKISKSCTVYIMHPDDDVDEVSFDYTIKNTSSDSNNSNSGSNNSNSGSNNSNSGSNSENTNPDGESTDISYDKFGNMIMTRYNHITVAYIANSQNKFYVVDPDDSAYLYENRFVLNDSTTLGMIDNAIIDAGLGIVVDSNGKITNLDQFTDIQRVTAVYKWMATHFTKVDKYAGYDNQPFYNYECTCGELSRFFCIFMRRLSVPVTSSSADSINHVWNVVRIGNDLYSIDISTAVTGSSNNNIYWCTCLAPDYNTKFSSDEFSCTSTDHIMGAEEIITYNSLEEVKAHLSDFQAYKAQGRRIAIKVPKSVCPVDVGRFLKGNGLNDSSVSYQEYRYFLITE